MGDPGKWTREAVASWVASLGFPEYSSAFLTLQVDGFMMMNITESDLAEDVGIKVRLHRVKIIEYFRREVDAFQQREQKETTVQREAAA